MFRRSVRTGHGFSLIDAAIDAAIDAVGRPRRARAAGPAGRVSPSR
ncbi:hypothetical protein [Polymorphospora rubra]